MKRRQHRELYEEFCENLISLREGASFTQQQLAKKLGKPQSFISKYESGERRLDIVELVTILDALGVTLAELSLNFPSTAKRVK